MNSVITIAFLVPPKDASIIFELIIWGVIWRVMEVHAQMNKRVY